jgi:monoamine oxidase
MAGEAASFAEALGAAQAGLRAAAAAGADGPASAVLPESGDWRATIDFTLGPMALSRDLDSVSAVEAAMAFGREGPSLRDGCGALLGQLAEGLPLQLATMVSRVDASGPEVRVETKKGTLRAGAVIVTASTAALASRRLRFVPDLPVSMTQAIAALPLGTLNPIAFELPEDPLGVGPDADITFMASSASTLRLIANIGGSAICLAMIGGRFGKELEEESDLVTVAWVRDFLVQRFGGAIGPRMGRSVVAHWGLEPTILGAASVAVPGAAAQRLALREPLAGCIYFAGEATSPDAFGTLHGAWLEGERAAGELLARSP